MKRNPNRVGPRINPPTADNQLKSASNGVGERPRPEPIQPPRHSPQGPILAYPIPVINSDRRLSSARRQKTTFPGFQIRMMSFYRDYVCAAADCTGLDSYHFCLYAILGAVNRAEKELGITAEKMVNLSKAQRAELAKKYRAVNGARIRAGRILKPEIN